MSDNDPCECYWNHELSMQRLISLLRQSQTACTDINCLEPVQRLDSPNASSGEDTNFILMTGIWVIVALALYFLRPNRARTHEEEIKKLPFGGSDDSGSKDPPPPPPSMGTQ
ncbi:uncharacterized protein C34C12.4 [Daktulosphaira vitifoliae]|uniref:uncharacterized protein C34C12.4 n=1 Tax=Daktulosphaira vitifoliae TaxID=58002 RepID=UPI0021A9A112|nr:uncharacterized protein C34C12.4 [Daktulosphaira vitifoliae]XP_050526420.1 uncharacterized protein C34C12.4 [Daktulosphaira vitifoliae]XP_050526421.1 uncharacterized protein C34C12.4 [Daktulosphaira vitifoliae]XP_050526422.1 uncharacterized protein C34C12.4 [Daktulosphaira vitifoliae]XP_050526423.1 uncharacterized protein C34C12.4 [Daktulosphaira vitifoliae]